MTQFGCDYLSGCHPAILDALVATNLEQTAGYGLDPYCEAARARIRAAVGSEAADVHFLVGGTQTNATVITSILRPWQGVIAADSGHIAVHETGAIEAGGHKVLTLPAADGKLDAAQLRDFMERYWLASGVKEHIVQPGMVYLSQPTELGTVYSRAELAALAQTCRHYRLPLFVDGARLGYALAPEVSDLTLPDLAALCDVFYIGGTKCGALFGEAVVIMNDAYKANFRAMMKRGGGLLAKGRLLGIQFDALFRDGLYQRICATAVTYAREIRAAFAAKGVAFFGASTTNQQFPILAREAAEYFQREFGFSYWEAHGEQEVLRYCTSWATTAEDVRALVDAAGRL